MLKKTITFSDLDGEQITEDFFFNISEPELIEMEVSEENGLSDTLAAIVKEKNKQKIIAYFKKVILLSYGEKSPDGRRFIKSPELSEAFSQTDAYTQLFLELSTNADAAAKFMVGIVPASFRDQDKPIIVPKANETDSAVTLVKDIVETMQPLPDYSKMTKKELLAHLEGQN